MRRACDLPERLQGARPDHTEDILGPAPLKFAGCTVLCAQLRLYEGRIISSYIETDEGTSESEYGHAPSGLPDLQAAAGFLRQAGPAALITRLIISLRAGPGSQKV